MASVAQGLAHGLRALASDVLDLFAPRACAACRAPHPSYPLAPSAPSLCALCAEGLLPPLSVA